MALDEAHRAAIDALIASAPPPPPELVALVVRTFSRRATSKTDAGRQSADAAA